MYFRLTRDGRPMSNVLSIYTECFGAIALAELSKAAGEPAYWERAVKMYERIRPRLGVPDNTAMLGYPINAEFHLHVHDMIRITVAWVFENLYPDDRWKADLGAVGRIAGRQALEAGPGGAAGKRRARRLADARHPRRPHVPSGPCDRKRVDADGNRLPQRRRDADGYGDRDRAGVAGTRLGQGIRRHPLSDEHRLDARAIRSRPT